jgi:hypothetical protein
MRIVIGLLALTAACGDDGNMFPVGGGGNDGGFTFPDGSSPVDARMVDAAVPPSDSMAAPIDANLIVGRVCLLTDARRMQDCATSGASGLTVRLGNAATTTAGDGSFTIAGQTGSGLVWRVTGPSIVSSFEVLADYQIPAITTTAYNALLAANNVTIIPGEGSLMIFAAENGAGKSGVSASVAPQAFYQPFYDGASATTWERTSTGTEGAIWIPGIDVGNATASLTPTKTTGSQPIFDGGITFVTVIYP